MINYGSSHFKVCQLYPARRSRPTPALCKAADRSLFPNQGPHEETIAYTDTPIPHLEAKRFEQPRSAVGL